jgi:hypothetical protein
MQTVPDNANDGQEPTTEYFARIPYKLFEARESGQITPSMFVAMLWCYRWADWATGSVEKMCAERLVWATDGESARRTFQEALHSLAEAHWIVSHCPRGGTRPYRVDICNYVALIGARKGQILNPSDIKTWRKPRKGVRAGNGTPSAQGVRADTAHPDGEHNGEANGEPSAPTMRVFTENTTRDSSGDFGSRDSREIPSPIYTGAKIETPKPALPPQTSDMVANLKTFIRMEAREHPEGIPTHKLARLRQGFIDDANAVAIPYKTACELYEATIRPFIQPTLPPPITPKPEPLPDASLDDLLAALRHAPANTAELVETLYHIRYDGNIYNARQSEGCRKVTAGIDKLRRRRYRIESRGPSSLEKKWVLTE